jgi:hypothetical protein
VRVGDGTTYVTERDGPIMANPINQPHDLTTRRRRLSRKLFPTGTRHASC